MPHVIIGTCVAALFPIAALGGSLYITATMFALVLAVGLWYVWSPRTRIMDVSVTLMGPIYTGFMLSGHRVAARPVAWSSRSFACGWCLRLLVGV